MRHCPPRLVCLFTVLALAGTTLVMANNETTTPPPSVPGLLSSFAGSKILLIGILDSHLTIITKDASPLVYDVPMAKFDNNKFDLYGLAPVELKSKWPALSGNANFTSKVLSKQLPLSISIKLDSEKLIFAFYFDPARDALETVTFPVNPPSASYQEYSMDIRFIFGSADFISSTEQNVFFNMDVDPGNSHQLIKYVYQAGGFNVSWSFYICKLSSETILFKEYNTNPCTDMDWDIPNGGFVHQNRFHLYSHGTVYIFEFNGVGSASGVQVKTVKLSDFFVSLTPSTTTTTELISTTTKNGSGMIIAILSVALVLSVIIIIGLVVWFKCAKQPDQELNSEAYRMGVSSQALGATATSGQDAIGSKDKRSRSPSCKAKQTSKAKLPKLGKHKTKASSLKGTK